MPNTPQTSEAARWLARANEAAGDKHVPADDVLTLYRKALALDPTMVEGWADYGASLGVLERYDEAVAALDKGLAVDPRHRRCLLFRGDALRRKGDLAAAIQAYHALVGAHPDDASAWVKYGNALDMVGRLPEALAAMERALQIRPRFDQALTGKANVELHMGRIPPSGIPLNLSPGQLMRAIAEAQAASVRQDMADAAATRAADSVTPQATSEPATADDCMADANKLLEGNEAIAALPYLERALQLAPRHLPALEAIVATLDKLGRPQDALAWCEKWLAHPLLKQRDRARALCAQGACLRALLDFVPAIAAIDKALGLDPGNVAFAKERATTVAAARDALAKTTRMPALSIPSIDEPRPHVASMVTGAGTKQLNEGIATTGAPPHRPMSRANLETSAQERLDRARQADHEGRKAEAIAGYRALLADDPTCLPAWMSLGVCLEELDLPDEALPCYDKALEGNGNEPRIWGQKGICLEKLGKLDEALAALDHCTTLAPQDPFGWQHKARIHYGRMRLPEALDAIEHALAANPAEPAVWRFKADTLERLGRLPECLAALDHYAQIVPGDVRANNRRLQLKQRIAGGRKG